MKKEELYRLIHRTINDISNDDENIGQLEKAMEFFCSNWDICEGMKHAIKLSLDDQYYNHFEELEINDLKRLLNILNTPLKKACPNCGNACHLLKEFIGKKGETVRLCEDCLQDSE